MAKITTLKCKFFGICDAMAVRMVYCRLLKREVPMCERCATMYEAENAALAAAAAKAVAITAAPVAAPPLPPAPPVVNPASVIAPSPAPVTLALPLDVAETAI